MFPKVRGSIVVERSAVEQEPRTRGWWARVAGFCDSDIGALLILISLALAAFSPWWAGGKYFAPLDLLDGLYEPWHAAEAPIEVHNHFTSDAVTQYLVYRNFAARSFAEDGAVGWSELTQGGRPEYANTMALYDDWSMQLHRFFDFWTAWHLGLFGQFLIAGVGMLVFLRGQRLSPAVALVGAVAYAANSQFIFYFYHRWHLGAFAWVPWLAWAFYSYRAGRRWAWPLVPLFLALACLGGSLQTTSFVGLTFVALWLGWLTEPPARPGARLAATGQVLAWGILGLGLASFALYPNVITLVEGLELGIDRGQVGYKHGLLQPILSTLLIALQPVPSLLGSPRTMDLTKALGVALHDVAYFGLLPMVLAYRTALLRDAPPAARWLIALGLLIPLTPLVGPLYHRVQLVFCFGGAWAFAWYWQHADRERLDPVLRRLGYLAVAGVAVWLVGSLATLVLEGPLQARIDGYISGRVATGQAGQFGSYREAWLLERGRQLLPELRLWHPRQLLVASTAALGCAALWLRTRRGVGQAALLLLAALVLELGAFARGWVTVVDPADNPPYVESAEIRALREHVGTGRVFIVDYPVAPSFFPPNTLAMYGIATIQAYETVGFRNMWSEAGYTEEPAALGRMGVTHAVSRPGVALADGWTPLYQGERLMVWRNEHAMPRYLALPAGSGWGEAGEEVDVASAEVVGGAGGVMEGGVSGMAAAVHATGTRNRRQLEVPPGTGTLRIAENWSEGWRYRTAGGAWHSVDLAQDRSMVISLGPSDAPVQLELDYHPHRRTVGWWITGGALLAILLGTGLTIRRRRPTEPNTLSVAVQHRASNQRPS